MKPRWYGSVGYRLIPLAGVTFFSGCLAAAERNLDVLLSPNALENTLFLSSGAAGPWLTFLVKMLVKVS